MKNKMISIWNRNKWYVAVLAGGIILGWLFFHTPGKETARGSEAQEGVESHDHEDEAATIWTCSMHPQIRQDKPGKCPICAMDLIPVSSIQSANEETHPDEIRLTESAAMLADVETLVVRKGSPNKDIYLQGKVQADERRVAELTARFGGRIEKLFISFTGEHVRKGQKLANIYSPGLVTAQKELLETLTYKETRPSIYHAARGKLKLWDLTDGQIDAIEQSGEPQMYFDILSPISGTVTKRHVALGDYVKEGTALFEVTDLSHVWIMFDAYESDLPWIKTGDRVNYTVPSLPGKAFNGNVVYIDPFIDPSTRVAKVRVEQNNQDLSLKPEMFVNGTIESRYAGGASMILIPKTSILWTGKRAVVYVKVPERDQPVFRYREIALGPESGSSYVVADGLAEGEEIAVNGVFKIDAAAQLEGKPSMMNPAGGAMKTGHDHGEASGAEAILMDLKEPESGGFHEANVSMKDEKENTGKGEVPVLFREQLQQVVASYITMKNAFVASDPGAVAGSASTVASDLKRVQMELLTGEIHMEWMNQLNALNEAINRIINSSDIVVQREGFAQFSQSLYGSIKTFGLQNETVYYQYCPMAVDDKGAFWLSETEDIRNPYFGEDMLTCGETRETLNFQK